MTDKVCLNGNVLSHVNEQDYDVDLQKSINSIIEKEGYVKYEVVVRNFNTHGGNFLGVLLEIDIKGTTPEGEKEINLFVKKEVDWEKITVLKDNGLILKELFVYTELSKVITHLQETANVPTEDRFKIAKTYPESSDHALIFENLEKIGYKTYGRFDIIPLKYMELAMKELGKLHAISFVIEKRMPDFFKNKIRTQENPFLFNDDWKGLMEKIYLYNAKQFDSDTKRRIEEFLPIAIKKYPMYDTDQTSVRCCLCHVDYRAANILVREIDGDPVDVIPVDYQLIDYGCPLRDLFYFIYSTTKDKDFRAKHVEHLKDVYFESMTRYLKYFDIDVEDVYPRKEFDELYKEWKDYGLIKAVYSSIFLFAPDVGLDNNLTLSQLPYEPGPEVVERVRDWIEEFIEGGYL